MIKKYLQIAADSYSGYFNYLVGEITHPSWGNYFYALVFISLAFFLFEQLFPWRRKQARFRLDFWLDGFYMFFNFFFFSLVAFNALSNLTQQVFVDGSSLLGIGRVDFISVRGLPRWGQLLLLFIIRDFIHFNIHRLLHRSARLWEFHRVHHSVKQMGFAAHLRFHWFENVVYRLIEYIPLHLIGFGITDFFLVHLVALSIGHFNHSNLSLPLGPLKYIFNNPQMHIWHHAKVIPFKYGCNYGISLSLWDYIFKTDYIPHNGRDIEIGFGGDEKFPKTFIKQNLYPIVKL